MEGVQWEGSSDGVMQQEWGFGNGQSSSMQQFLTGTGEPWAQQRLVSLSSGLPPPSFDPSPAFD